MVDLFHSWGTDLTVDATGDIAVTDGTAMTTQRVYRRLLTNPGDYIWNLTYGGGLPAYIGTPIETLAIESVVRDQLQLEPAIAASPAAIVSTEVIDHANGIVTLSISYTGSDGSTLNQLSIELGQ